jgi:Histidine-specific methyltransferase, SAM-dependent/TIR domain
MSGIFISHASSDKPLVDPFVDTIVRLGCRVPSEQIFYSSGDDTGIPSGSDLNATVRRSVSKTGLVVSLITHTFQTRPYCIAEMGAAWSRVNNLFPLRDPSLTHSSLDGVLNGMLVRSFDDEAALDELHERICDVTKAAVPARTWSSYKKKWLDALPSYLASMPSGPEPSIETHVAAVSGDQHWGQLFDSFVDAALYTNDNSTSRTDILNHVESKTLVPSRYLYASDSGADRWIELCDDPMYRHYRETKEFWAGATGREMAALIHSELACNEFDYISLGSGDGEKDGDLILHWLDMSADIFYYPYDISLRLVSRAHQTVREKVRNAASNKFHIKAVLADFSYLKIISQVFAHRNCPNVVSLLGNSLGNMTGELAFLRKLASVMSPVDLLVLEVRLQSNSSELQEVETEHAKRFDFGPLEYYLGMKFDPTRMTSKRVSRASPITGTKTMVAACRHDEHGEIKLSYIHEYKKEVFLQALTEAGFEEIKSKVGGESNDFLVCIARPKPKRKS